MKKIKSGQSLKDINNELHDIEAIALESVCRQSDDWEYVSERLKNDTEFILRAMEKNGKIFKLLSDKQRGTKNIVLEAVKNDRYNWEFASDKLRDDNDFALEAVRENGKIFNLLSDEQRGTKNIALEAVKNNGYNLEFASVELRGDKDVVLEAVKDQGDSLGFASDELRNNTVVVLEAVRKFSRNFYFYASDEMKNDREFVLKAVKQNGLILHFVLDKYKTDINIVLEAGKQNYEAFYYMSPQLYEIVSFIEIVQNNCSALNVYNEAIDNLLQYKISINNIRLFLKGLRYYENINTQIAWEYSDIILTRIKELLKLEWTLDEIMERIKETPLCSKGEEGCMPLNLENCVYKNSLYLDENGEHLSEYEYIFRTMGGIKYTVMNNKKFDTYGELAYNIKYIHKFNKIHLVVSESSNGLNSEGITIDNLFDKIDINCEHI